MFFFLQLFILHSKYCNLKCKMSLKNQILNCTYDQSLRQPTCQLCWLFLRISFFCVWKISWSTSEMRQYLLAGFFGVWAHVRNAQKQAVIAQNDFSFTFYLRSVYSVLIWNDKIDIWDCWCQVLFLKEAWTPHLLRFFSLNLITVFHPLILRQ